MLAYLVVPVLQLNILTCTRISVTLALTLACSLAFLLSLSHALSHACSRSRIVSRILALVLINTEMNTTRQSLIHKGSNHGVQKLGDWCWRVHGV